MVYKELRHVLIIPAEYPMTGMHTCIYKHQHFVCTHKNVLIPEQTLNSHLTKQQHQTHTSHIKATTIPNTYQTKYWTHTRENTSHVQATTIPGKIPATYLFKSAYNKVKQK